MKIASKTSLLLVSAWCLASQALAQLNTMAQSARTGEESDVLDKGEGGSLTLSASAMPDYADSGKSRVALMPGLEYRWANGWFASTERGVGYNFSKESALQYGVGLGVDMGRQSGGALSGMGDVDARLEYLAFMQYARDRAVQLSSSVRYGSGNDRLGLVVDLGAGYNMDVAPDWKLGVGVGTSWANADYMQTYFGVTQSQSGHTGFAVYTPGAGFRDLTSSLTLGYALAPGLTVSGGLAASTLVGDARNSPIVSSSNRVSASLSVRYAF